MHTDVSARELGGSGDGGAVVATAHSGQHEGVLAQAIFVAPVDQLQDLQQAPAVEVAVTLAVVVVVVGHRDKQARQRERVRIHG